MSAKGKEFKVNVSTNRATAISSSAGSYPNVLYFPTDDPNSIIFNRRIYDLNRLITAPVILDDAKSLDTYKGISNAGVYVGRSGNKILNKPGGVDAFILQAFSYLPNEIHYQILYSGNKIYSRRYVESSSLWTPWEKLGAEGLTSIPKATTSALGGVMLGYTNSGRNYKLELDSNGKAFVNVPWTDTTYSNATTKVSGLMSTSDKSKLDGITSSADAVSFSRVLSSGTKIGTITINGTNTDIYAPTAREPVEYGVATSTTLGLVMIGYPGSGKNYPVKLNSSNQMYVNVPWTDNNTTYSAGAGLSLSGTAFSLVKATPTTLGGVKVSSTEISTISTVAATTFGSQNRIYPVQLAYPSGSAGTDGNKVLSVYVPWENTTYGIATSSKSGLFGASDKADFDRIRSAWVNGAVFVNRSSPLYNLAIGEAVGGRGEYLAYFGDDGVLEKHTTIDVNYIPVTNKSNNWSAYQDFKSGAGNSGSDMRFKKEVTCMPDVLDNLMSLNVIKYIWEHPDENGIRCTFGVKADQLLSLGGVYATMVHSRADKYDTKWVEYDRFGVLAIKALQEVVMRNKQLESRIEYLEDTINSMRRVWEENS